MKRGTIVRLKMPCLGNDAGDLGVCYEEYDIGEPGAGSVIFENGSYDGFNPAEQIMFLEEIGFNADIANYQFMNVMQLSRDFENGMFNYVLGI